MLIHPFLLEFSRLTIADLLNLLLNCSTNLITCLKISKFVVEKAYFNLFFLYGGKAEFLEQKVSALFQSV